MRMKELIERMYENNDENLSRPLLESIVAPEVTAALRDWIGSAEIPGTLIGGLALSFYVRPRQTMDVDVVYATEDNIPDQIPGFKKVRPHTFQHNKTHVEVEVLSPEFLNVPPQIISRVVATAVKSSGMWIASKAGLVAMKLQRGNRQDQADIEQLIQSGGVDLTMFQEWLTPEQMKLYNEIRADVEGK